MFFGEDDNREPAGSGFGSGFVSFSVGGEFFGIGTCGSGSGSVDHYNRGSGGSGTGISGACKGALATGLNAVSVLTEGSHVKGSIAI